MNASGELGPPPPPPRLHGLSMHRHLCHRHHHQHIHIVPNCPLHSFLLKPPSHHSPSCPLFSPFPHHLSPQPVVSAQLSGISNIPAREPDFSDAMMMQEENLVEEEPDEEEEPIFVLTDEWRDFFAQSEAKWKLAKKQAKKRKN